MKTGIHFQRCNTKSAALHNERDPEYLASVERSGKKHYDIFHDRTQCNSHWIHTDYAGKSLDTILDEMRKRYRDSVGQAPQEKDRVRLIKGREKIIAGWSPIREGVCPVREDTTPQDFLPFRRWLKERGVEIISIDIHLDEGHLDPHTGERIYNRHAHIICDWTNHVTGKTVKLDDTAMSEAQTILANSLNMERGVSKSITGVDHVDSIEYRERKAADTLKMLESEITQAEITLAQINIEVAKAVTAKRREELRRNIADIAARITAILGRGELVQAKNDLATAESARISAENARNLAENARIAAEMAETKARQEKAEFGQKMHDKGYIEGQGLSYRMLQQKSAEINFAAEAYPRLENLVENTTEMSKAGLTRQQQLEVIREGKVTATVKLNNWQSATADVTMSREKRSQKMKVWFNGFTLADFVRQALAALRQKGIKRR